MTCQSRGFSLIELLFALTIALGIGLTLFDVFHQNERAFRDQSLIVEMQQSARLVASQIADELRMAGQGMPIYASTFDDVATEPAAIILESSSSRRIDFRAGLSNVEANVTTLTPIDLSIGISRTLGVNDSTGFVTGKFVYIWAPASNSMWTWVRAEITDVTSGALTVIPRQARTDVVRFSATPVVLLEEAVSFYFTNNSIKRATATDMTNQTVPVWSPANEVGRNFTSLAFTYYDRDNNVVAPTSLERRLAIARVDIQVVAQTADILSDGTRPTYTLALRTIPRNSRIR